MKLKSKEGHHGFLRDRRGKILFYQWKNLRQGDYENAKKFADRAYAKQGGSTGEQTELSLVYQRLRRLTGE